MRLRKYMVYMDDGVSVFKLAIPAENKKKAEKEVEGNGEIIDIKEVPDWHISVEKIADALYKAEFGQYEIDFITRALKEIGIAEYSG